MKKVVRAIFLFMACLAVTYWQPAMAQITPAQIGVLVMHGKGGSPDKHVAELASSLGGNGFLVVNLDMPWSGRRQYDATVSQAEEELRVAIEALRAKGAQKIFLAGHSQGGVFALYAGGKLPVQGVIAIAPGGDVANQTFREKLGSYVDMARTLVAEGKGDEKARLADFEGSKGVEGLLTTPRIYLTWFDPQGAMSQRNAMAALKVPVLYVAPSGDYPGLQRIKQAMYGALPPNPLNKLYEPNSSHLGAPSASREEIARWMLEVANPGKP